MKKIIIAASLTLALFSSCADNSSTSQSSSSSRVEYVSTTSEISNDEPYVPIPDLSGFEVTDPFSYKTDNPEINGDSPTLKSITFYRDGKRICGKYYLPEGDGPFPVVVLSSGQTAAYTIYEDEAKAFSESGIACVIFDFTGAVGRKLSDGELTESSVFTEVQDLNAILDSLSELPKADTNNVFLWGHSLGGLVSTYTGCNRPDDIKGMILLEPSFTYPDFTRYNNPDLSQVPDVINDPKLYNTLVGKQFVIDMCSLDIMKEMEKCDKDVLIILGNAGEKKSSYPALGYTYPEAFEMAGQRFTSSETITVEGADHLFQGEYGKTAVEKSIGFIKKHL